MIERTCIIFNIYVIGWRTRSNNDADVFSLKLKREVNKKMTQSKIEQSTRNLQYKVLVNKQATCNTVLSFVKIYLIKITISLWMIHDHHVYIYYAAHPMDERRTTITTKIDAIKVRDQKKEMKLWCIFHCSMLSHKWENKIYCMKDKHVTVNGAKKKK